jgi:signal transduction histidine kinase
LRANAIMPASSVKPFWMVATALVILALALYIGLFEIAQTSDNRRRMTEQTIVASALRHAREKLGDTLAQNAYWDEAYDHVAEPIDRKWIDVHLGAYSAETVGIPLTAIFSPRRTVIYEYSSRALGAAAASLARTPTVMALIDHALTQKQFPPAATTAFVRMNGHLFIAAAQRIVPNDSRAHGTLLRHFALSYFLPLDQAGLAALQTDFHVAALGWSNTSHPGRASIPVRDARGQVIQYLEWSASTPGATFARAAAPYALLCFILVAAVQLIVLRSWMDAARKLRDESVARTMFIANASHELRTPLNAIIGFSECLATEMFGPLSNRYREYADDILTSGKLLLSIVNDVLDLTRINSSEAIPAKPLPLAESLRQPLRMLDEYAKPESVAIRFSDASGNAVVNANEKALNQIFLNLGSNAVKFSPRGGVVDISISRNDKDQFVELSVRDNGPGIPADKLKQVGQPFFQAHQGRESRPGSGLGLAIVKALAQKLGGEFSLDSNVGIGTTAILRLPIVRELDKIAA